MNQALLDHIGHALDQQIDHCVGVSGGDISRAYLLEAGKERFFAKVNEDPIALDMFIVERKGIEEISDTKTISTPEVMAVDRLGNNAFLVMEYIDNQRPGSIHSAKLLGTHLAEMHRVRAKSFGWAWDNFIGTLPQSNQERESWTDFYVNGRLWPQLSLALSQGRIKKTEIPSVERMIEVCAPFFQDVTPGLIHGDLWSGNYLISKEGKPYLIDPAVYYGHGEVDIAMSRLFGGFDAAFYDSYHEVLPMTDGYTERMDIYQLYYLLVHLNLFGSSYYGSVMRIMKRYFL